MKSRGITTWSSMYCTGDMKIVGFMALWFDTFSAHGSRVRNILTVNVFKNLCHDVLRDTMSHFCQSSRQLDILAEFHHHEPSCTPQ